MVFRYVGNKTFDFSSKKKDFLPKNDQIWSEIGISVHCWLIWCPVALTLFNIGEAYFLPIGSIWQSKGEGSKIIDDDKKESIWLNDLMLYFKNCHNING